jgi:drug/metabolite transporter (DMT)-like permease
VCVIWGTTYLAIRVALETIPPFLMGGLRWTAAGCLLLSFLKIRGELLPARGAWPSLAVLGIPAHRVRQRGVVWAEQSVPSGLTFVLVSSTPFWMVGVEQLMTDGERITLRHVIGLLIGLCGIVLHQSGDRRPARDGRAPRAVQRTNCRGMRRRARGHRDRQKH